jgi:hypothetical protein
MERQQFSESVAAWVEAWLHGNARPEVVLTTLRALAARHGGDAGSRALVERGWRIVLNTPFGSVPQVV